MAGRRRKFSVEPENQLSLFDVLQDAATKMTPTEPAPGSMDMGSCIRQSISEAIRRSGLKRWEIAGRMSELLGVEITESMLNAWSAESREDRRFPAEYLAAFCYVTGDREILRAIARKVHCWLLESEEAVMAELGRINWQRQQLAAREREVKAYLAEMKRRRPGADRAGYSSLSPGE
ncbi:MAG: hypothetical protein BAA04_08255 [Firmicutes bacterium ZCTH02-B6]|nr:MAG: hypothetical protein BAA04_08255 [Firmicutes bacterium ZCTH02-B6]